MGKVAVTPLMHLVWHQMLAAADPKKVSPAAVRIGVQIGTHFNNNTAETYVGLGTIAKELRISPRGVWGGVDALKREQLLNVRRGGRATNYYSMPLERVAAECEIRFSKSRSGLPNSVAESPQRSARLGKEISQKPDQNFATGCVQTLPSLSGKNSTACWAETLANRIGMDRFAAWFDRVTVQSVHDGTVTLSVPNRFLKSRIEAEFSSQIIESFAHEHPDAKRLAIIVATITPVIAEAKKATDQEPAAR
jgi:hypothetical protein